MIKLLFMVLWEFNIDGALVEIDLARFDVDYENRSVLILPDKIFNNSFEL